MLSHQFTLDKRSTAGPPRLYLVRHPQGYGGESVRKCP